MRVKIPAHRGRAVNLHTKKLLLDEARTWLGTPFRHLGRSRRGVDCAGLLIEVVRKVLGARVVVDDYPVWPDQKAMRQMCNQILFRLQAEILRPGDVALLYAPGVGVVHLGWFTGRTLIHASNEPQDGQVVETPLEHWQLRGAYEVPDFVGGER